MKTALMCLGVFLGGAWVGAAPIAVTLGTNQTRYDVNVATNTEIAIPNNPFVSDSLARSAGGILYSADPAGVIWDVTASFQIPVGPTGRTQIGDLVVGSNGLWGFSNASQELFFFDFGSAGVTSAQVISGLGGATVTGVAYEGSTGDVYLSGNTGLNTDTLFRVPNASAAATTVGPMANGDAFSYFSDIEFDASGTLYAMSWFNRWFYTVDPANGTTSLVSTGPHRDGTAMALVVPEPSTCIMALAGLACGGYLVKRRRKRA
jgi:hypothetical protein